VSVEGRTHGSGMSGESASKTQKLGKKHDEASVTGEGSNKTGCILVGQPDPRSYKCSAGFGELSWGRIRLAFHVSRDHIYSSTLLPDIHIRYIYRTRKEIDKSQRF
jgi:hypothetical protein